MQEAYENLGKWGRGETTRPYVLGPNGHPVDSTGKPIEVVTQAPCTDSRLTDAQMARQLGYPEPPAGYHWAKHGDDVILKRNPGMGGSLPRLEYDPASGKLNLGATSAGAHCNLAQDDSCDRL